MSETGPCDASRRAAPSRPSGTARDRAAREPGHEALRSKADVAIVGGGLAGAAAALRLARAGRHVVVLERAAAPQPKVCGEFLSGVALCELSALGLPAEALGAVPLSTARASARGRTVETALPFPAASLTRARLDEALLSAARAAGADLRRPVTVRAVDRSEGGWRITTSAGPLDAAHAVIACGKSDMPARRRGHGLHGGLVGLKLHAALDPAAADALADAVELVLFPHGYCGVQPVEDGCANACLVVEPRVLKACGGGAHAAFDAVRATPRGAALLDGARPAEARPVAVGHLPYGFVRRTTDGAFHLGDQAAVIPSFCGEGMALALCSARLAAEALLAGEPAHAFQARFAALAGRRVKGAALLSRALCAPGVQAVAAAAGPAAPAFIRAIASATRTPVPSPAR